MVSHRRAQLLEELGFKTISDVAHMDLAKLCMNDKVKYSKDGSFSISLSLMKNFALAICSRKPIVTGVHPIFTEALEQPFFIDLEYNSEGTKSHFLHNILLNILHLLPSLSISVPAGHTDQKS